MRTKNEKKSSYREPLILIAFVILGAILGIVLGEKASVLYPIGQIWLNLLFVLLVPLIFFSIASSIANIADARRVGKLLALTIGIFVVTAAIAGIYMFAVTGIFGVDTSIQLDISEVAAAAAADSVGDQIVNTFTVSDFPLVISRSHILALIVFTVFFGITVSLLGEQGKPVASWLNSMSLVFYKMVALLMKLAPPALTALGTRSSAAALPLQLDACDKLGVPREVSSVVVPVGATCHMDGACIATIYEIALCCALFGHPLKSIGDFAFALLIAVAGSVAVSSVPGAVERFLE